MSETLQHEYFDNDLKRIEKRLVNLGRDTSLYVATTLRYEERNKKESNPISIVTSTDKEKSSQRKTAILNNRDFLILRFRYYDAEKEYYRNQDIYMTALQVFSFRSSLKRCISWLVDEDLFDKDKAGYWVKSREVENLSVKLTFVGDKLLAVYPDLAELKKNFDSERVVFFSVSKSVYDCISFEEACNLYEMLGTLSLPSIGLQMLQLLKDSEKRKKIDPFKQFNNRLGVNLYLLDAIMAVMTPEKFSTLESLAEIDLSDFVNQPGLSFEQCMESFKIWLLSEQEDDYDQDRKRIYRFLTQAE